MKAPTKEELYIRIAELERQNEKISDELYTEQKREWEKRKGDATKCFYVVMRKTFPGLLKDVNFEHVDKAGYWFTFELANDSRRQTYVVRHNDF